MSKTFEERVIERKAREARAAFAGYVQSVAFNMTLSRNMVDMLGYVRDYERLSEALRGRSTAENKDRIVSHSVPLLNALIRRGLVLHTPFVEGRQDQAPHGWRWYRLTRAGELMVDLLIEAGLLSAAAPAKRKRA